MSQKFVLGLCITIITACGTQLTPASHQSSGSQLGAMHRKLIPLSKGEYLVKIERMDQCASQERPVIQNWQYPEPTERKNPIVELSLSDDSSESKINSTNCYQGKSFGWTVLTLMDQGSITTGWATNEIVSVESVETVTEKSSVSEIVLAENADYIVDIELESTCINEKVTLVDTGTTPEARDSQNSIDTKTFTSFMKVTDNLFHRAICRTPAVKSASEYIKTSKNPVKVASAGSIKKFQKIMARKIVQRSKINPLDSENVKNEFEIIGTDGDKLMTAFESLGVIDAAPMYGAKNLIIKQLRCDRNLAESSPKVRCGFTALMTDTQTPVARQGLIGQASEAIFLVLQNYGAAIPAGINPNYEAVGAAEILCSRPVVPNPISTCRVSLF